MKKIFLITAFAFAAALAALPLSAADFNAKQRSVHTLGTVNFTIPADSAKLTVFISALEPALEQSNSRLDATVSALLAEIKTRGISEKSVVQKNRDVRKQWNESNSKGGAGRILLYRTSVQVIISIDDISKLSPLVTFIKLHEEYDSYSQDLFSSKIGVARKAAFAAAMRAARDKAEVLAKEGGAKLGALLNATEDDARGNARGDNFSGNQMISISQQVDAINGSQLYSVGTGNDFSGNDNDSDNIAPAGEHVISINVRIRATFALDREESIRCTDP